MISEARLHALLEPFGLQLTTQQSGKVLVYLDLLLRWNSKINLTAIRNPEECVTRHFGESLYLAKYMDITGNLLDVGSGAGFPGLALRILFPDVATTLLEPIAKKRAFLKEVARACEIHDVQVRRERMDEFLKSDPKAMFQTVSMRAVGQLRNLVQAATPLIEDHGKICLWLTTEQLRALEGTEMAVRWDEPIPIPLARQRVILVGTHR
jgi:16S rRNA (guanine527-N7)-methyltransferase